MNARRDDIANVSAIVSGGLVSWLIHPLIGIGIGAATYILAKYPNIATKWNQGLVNVPPMETLRALSAAWYKMRMDFSNSSLKSIELLDNKEAATIHELSSVLGQNLHSRIPEQFIPAISEESWYGRIMNNNVTGLRDEVQRLGRPLKVSCSSLSVACVAVLKGLRQHNIDAELVIDSPSGLEQAKRINDDSVDFYLIADAPFFLVDNEELGYYKRIHEIYRERQGVVKKKGKSKGTPSIWTYPDSSAKLQLKIARQRSLQRKFSLPPVLKERMISLKGIATCHEFMSSGDYIFAWEPLLSPLCSNPVLEYLEGSDYELTISLFAHERIFHDTSLISAFSNFLIGEWNYCSMNGVYAWARLVRDKTFRENFAIGSGSNILVNSP